MKKSSINKSDLAILKKYQNHFQTAANGYFRGVYHNDVVELKAVYEKLGYKLTNEHCGECIMAMLKILGNTFFLISAAGEKAANATKKLAELLPEDNPQQAELDDKKTQEENDGTGNREQS